MDGYDALLFFIGGIVAGVLGLTIYKGAFDRKQAKMDAPWMREQRRMQILDDRRIQ